MASLKSIGNSYMPKSTIRSICFPNDNNTRMTELNKKQIFSIRS